MITASGAQEKAQRRSRPAPTTSWRSRSTRPSCSRASARCCGSSATTTRSRQQATELAGLEPSSSSGASTSRSSELERLGRLRRFLSPQLADLIVSSGDDSFLESHRREITVVFCDLRGFTPFAETVEPEDVMAGPARVPRGARRADPPVRGHARALHRRRADGVLQRSDPVRRRAAARRADGGRDARARRASCRRSGAGAATSSASASGSPRATPRSAGSGSRGAPTTRPSAASRTSRPGSATRRSRGRSSSASGCTPPRRT